MRKFNFQLNWRQLIFILVAQVLLPPILSAGRISRVKNKKVIVKLNRAEAGRCFKGNTIVLTPLGEKGSSYTGRLVKLNRKIRKALIETNEEPTDLPLKAKYAVNCGESADVKTDIGFTIHKPYTIELSGMFSLNSLDTKQKVGGESSDPISESDYEFWVKGLYIIGPYSIVNVGLGLDFSYYRYTKETTEEIADGFDVREQRVTSTQSTSSFGPILKLYFGDINQDKFIPFTGFSYLMSQSSEKSGEDDETVVKGSQISLFGGLDYFLVTHIALAPELEYQMITNAESTGEVETDESKTGFSFKLSLGIFF